MRPLDFAKQYNIAFTARYVKPGDYGRMHFKAILKNKASDKCISIDYSPSPLHNPGTHMQERKQALDAALCWIAHCAESLYWYERDTASANKYAAWLPETIKLPYHNTEHKQRCNEARKYRHWLNDESAWIDLVNGIIESDDF